MQLDPQTPPQHSIYRLLIGCVVPRPIAWVSSRSATGVPNLAPFSFFMGLCGDPPTSAFSSGRREGNKKDTIHNIEHTGDFVVNLVDDDLAEQMNLTSGDYPPDVDEFVLTGLTSAPSVKVQAPRVLEAPINLECRVLQTLPVGRGPHSLVLGEIVYFHVRDSLYQDGRIDMHGLRPVGRLAGHLYTHVHDIFEMKRPCGVKNSVVSQFEKCVIAAQVGIQFHPVLSRRPAQGRRKLRHYPSAASTSSIVSWTRLRSALSRIRLRSLVKLVKNSALSPHLPKFSKPRPYLQALYLPLLGWHAQARCPLKPP